MALKWHPASRQMPDSHVPPLQSHFSQTLIHSLLLLFTLIFLPRSTYPYKLDGSDAPPQTKSADKPQTPWLNPITYNPAYTLCWWILGSLVIFIFRAGWVRRVAHGPSEPVKEKKVEKKGDEKMDPGKVLLERLIQALLASMLLMPFTSIILVLMGAPISIDYTRFFGVPSSLTPLLAMLLNVLTFFTPCYTLGLPIKSIRRLLGYYPVSLSLGIGSTEPLTAVEKSEDEKVTEEWLRIFIRRS